MLFVPRLLAYRSTGFSNIVQSVVGTGMQLLLDPGDAACYPGSGQTLTDLSGNGRDFVRGATSSSEGSDPTFNGTANGHSASEYFSYDGGDYFTKASANGTFINSITKDNALFTLIYLAYATTLTTSFQSFACGNAYSSLKPGFEVSSDGGVNKKVDFQVYRADGSFCGGHGTTALATDNSWNLIQVAIDEAAATGLMFVNGTSESFTGSYTTPSALDPGSVLQIGASGSNNSPEASGHRFGGFALVNRALSSVDLTAIYNGLKSKYSLP